jgi:hypothetical protein
MNTKNLISKVLKAHEEGLRITKYLNPKDLINITVVNENIEIENGIAKIYCNIQINRERHTYFFEEEIYECYLEFPRYFYIKEKDEEKYHVVWNNIEETNHKYEKKFDGKFMTVKQIRKDLFYGKDRPNFDLVMKNANLLPQDEIAILTEEEAKNLFLTENIKISIYHEILEKMNDFILDGNYTLFYNEKGYMFVLIYE